MPPKSPARNTKEGKREAMLRRARKLDSKNVEQHYDNLQQLYIDCSSSFENVKPVAEVIANRPWIESLTVEQRQQLISRGRVILEDVNNFKNSIQVIYDKHKNLFGTEKNVFNVVWTFQIAEEYIQWQDSYDNLVTSAVGEFLSYNEKLVVMRQTNTHNA